MPCLDKAPLRGETGAGGPVEVRGTPAYLTVERRYWYPEDPPVPALLPSILCTTHTWLSRWTHTLAPGRRGGGSALLLPLRKGSPLSSPMGASRASRCSSSGGCPALRLVPAARGIPRISSWMPGRGVRAHCDFYEPLFLSPSCGLPPLKKKKLLALYFQIALTQRWLHYCYKLKHFLCPKVYFFLLMVPGGSDSKVFDPGSIPGSGRSPGKGNGNPLQYSCLGNSMAWGAW